MSTPLQNHPLHQPCQREPCQNLVRGMPRKLSTKVLNSDCAAFSALAIGGIARHYTSSEGVQGHEKERQEYATAGHKLTSRIMRCDRPCIH